MTEGPLGFDRRFAESVLELTFEYSKDTPLGRDEEFTNEFLKRLRNEKIIINRKVDIDVSTRDLDPDEQRKTALGFVIDEVGVLKIQFTKPPVIELEDYLQLVDNMNSIVFNVFELLQIDAQGKLIGPDEQTISAKVNGPAGGPRPFVSSEIIFEAVYEDPMFSNDVNFNVSDSQELEEFFQEAQGIRVDAKADGNRMLVNLRKEKVDGNKIRSFKAILRDFARSSVEFGRDDVELQTASIIANGGMM